MPYKFVKTEAILGEKFGRLLALSIAERSLDNHIMIECRCDCGNIFITRKTSLITGRTKSCGCLNKEGNPKHGMCGTPEYSSWVCMKSRCINPNNTEYYRYGGRGITICQEWIDSFPAFYEDMGQKPDGLTLERIDNDSGYFPVNCKWATPTEQSRNTRIPKTNKTGVKGVFFNKKRNRFRAAICVNYKSIFLGHFKTLEEATKARKEGEMEYFGRP